MCRERQYDYGCGCQTICIRPCVYQCWQQKHSPQHHLSFSAPTPYYHRPPLSRNNSDDAPSFATSNYVMNAEDAGSVGKEFILRVGACESCENKYGDGDGDTGSNSWYADLERRRRAAVQRAQRENPPPSLVGRLRRGFSARAPSWLTRRRRASTDSADEPAELSSVGAREPGEDIEVRSVGDD
jgi:hypothetical protein